MLDAIGNKMPKISVLVGTYNGEKYITEQIQSIFNQTVVPHEIIISDDDSTDRTVGTICEYINRYPSNTHISLIKNERKHGVVDNFINAFNHASGDIVFFCDQDDVWKREKIEHSLQFYDDPTVVAVFCNAEIVDCALNSKGVDLWGKIKYRPILNSHGYCKYSNGELIPELLKHNVVTGMCLSVRRNAVEFNGIPDDVLHDAWIAWTVSLRGVVIASSLTEVLYRQHAYNVVGSESKFSKERAKNYRSIRMHQIASLENRYRAFDDYRRKKSVTTEYDDCLCECIRFQMNRKKSCSKKVVAAFFDILKMYFKGQYKKFTEDNYISMIKDVYTILKT